MAQGKPSTAQALQLAQSCASVLGIVRPIAYCQEAGFIIVSYHLIANMNTVVAKMRRAAIKEASYEDLQLLKKNALFLLKSPENLDATGEAQSGNSWRTTASDKPFAHSKKSFVRSFDNVMNASPRGR